jgi:FtsH-binding integral membrane protein
LENAAMSSMVVWMLSLTIGLCGTILAAGAFQPALHLAACGAISIAFAIMAMRENSRQTAAQTAPGIISATTAHYMGLVWSWGALTIVATYLFILRWPEWWQFFLGFAVAAVLCLLYAAVMLHDAEKGREDSALLKLGRLLAAAQLVGMTIAVVGLFVDKKVTHFMAPTRYPDWAANNIAICGAVALALISGHALWSGRKKA